MKKPPKKSEILDTSTWLLDNKTVIGEDKLNLDPKPEVESELTPLRAQELAVSDELRKTISLPEKSLKSPRKKRTEIPSE